MPINDTTEFYVGDDLINTASQEYKDITISKKMAYTEGGEFFYEGNEHASDYVGYYNYTGGRFYRTKYKQEDELKVKENVSTDILNSTKFTDRTIFTILNPSYNLDDLLFKPNELINKNSINFKLNLLYENFKDLFIFANVSNPLIPTDFNKYAVLSADETDTINWNWLETDVRFISGGLDPSLVKLSAYNGGFTDANGTKILTINSKKAKDEYSLFAATSAFIYVYQLDRNDTLFDFVLSTTALGFDQQLSLRNVTSIAADKENDIFYINDRNLKQVFKTDVKTIVNKDRTGVRKMKLLNTIGGEGTEDTNFNGNSYIEYGNKNIFVFDEVDKSIKKFSEDFIFKIKYANKKLFTANKFISMTYNKTFDLLYVVTDTFLVLVLNGNNFNEVDQYTFGKNPFDFSIPLISFFEKPRKIVFSENNSNIYYLQTSKNVYKYFVNTQNQSVERFTIDINFDSVDLWNTVFSKFSAFEVAWDKLPDFDKFTIASNGLEIISSDTSKDDKLLMWANTRIFSFTEDNNFLSLLNTQNPNFYKKSEIFIKDEYFNNITFNTTIFRHLFNLNLFASNLNKKLLAEFDTVETDGYLRFKEFLELVHEDKETLDLNNQKQFFVGVNETLNGNTLNRVITNLFDYQNRLIEAVKTKRIGERIPLLKTVIIDK